MQIDILAMLKTAIAAGLVLTMAVLWFYFWLKRDERKRKHEREASTNKRLDIF